MTGSQCLLGANRPPAFSDRVCFFKLRTTSFQPDNLFSLCPTKHRDDRKTHGGTGVVVVPIPRSLHLVEALLSM